MENNTNDFNAEKIYFYNEKISMDTKICRYMDFDFFLQILNKKFYVPRKLLFQDKREMGQIMPDEWLEPRPVYVDKETAEKEYHEKKERQKQRENSKLLLTSCWTKDEGENFLMWKSYTSRIGVCLHTTLEKFLQAVGYDHKQYVAICSPLTYQKVAKQKDYLESLCSKDPYYQSEQEIRLYFIHENGLTNSYKNGDIVDNTDFTIAIQESIKNDVEAHAKQQKESMFKNYEIFEVSPEKLIDHITLSPFIKTNTYQYFVSLLMGQYQDIFGKYNPKRTLCPHSGKIQRSNIIIE